MSGVVLCTGPGETGVLIGREPSVYRILVCAGPSKVGVLVCLRLYCVQVKQGSLCVLGPSGSWASLMSYMQIYIYSSFFKHYLVISRLKDFSIFLTRKYSRA